MRTNKTTAALIPLLLAAAVSCDKEYDYEKKVKLDTPAKVSLSVQGIDDVVALLAPKTKTYTVVAAAGPVADETLTLSIAVDLAKLNAWNKANGTSYESVPGDAVELSSNSLMLPRYNTVSTTAQLTLKSGALPDDDKTRALALAITKVEGSGNLAMTAADSTVIIFFKRKIIQDKGFELGSGTEDDPYIIRNSDEMVAINRAMKSGETTYFKMTQDVDMDGYEDWLPLNAEEPYDKAVSFDGGGHRITGLTYTPSTNGNGMFHTLVGEFRDVVFENSTVDGLSATGGLLAATVGAEDAPTTVEGVTFNNVTLNVKGTPSGVGPLAGIVVNSTIKDISVNNVSIADADGDGKGPNNAGGVAGVARYVKSSFVNVTSSGKVCGAERSGGILGNVPKESTKKGGTTAGTSFENCSSSVDVTGSKYVGGLVGLLNADDITVKSCHATGSVSNTGTDTGGLVGWCGMRISMTDCYATGSVTGSDHYMGGLVGSLYGNAEVKRCWATGNVTSKATTTKSSFGGLIGIAARDKGDSVIEDCYAAGNVTCGASGRFGGGLVGTIENKSGVVINRCFSSGEVTTSHSAVGGLVGICKSSTLTDASLVNTVTNCIVWSPRIRNDYAGQENRWSSGAVIGVSNTKNTLTNNWRCAGMEFFDINGETLFDCEDSDPSHPITYAGTHQANFYPYHGKAAAAGATISSVAKSIGWPEDVWDLSGDVPVLK